MKRYFQDINSAIKILHNQFGVGDIQTIQRFADGRVEVEAKGYGMKPHKRKGRIVQSKTGQTVRMYGHQLTVVIV